MFRRRRSKLERYLEPKKKWRVKNPRVFYCYKLVEFTASRLRKLASGVEIRRHTTLSRDAYNDYDDWEMQIYERGQTYTLKDGQMQMATFREIRDVYVAPVIAEIERLRTRHPDRQISVLEVGCGNGTNLVLLRAHFGDTIKLLGFDIAETRVGLGQKYWGERLAGVTLSIDSATELSGFAEKSIDLLYSVHCLEQLPYHVHDAVAAMSRVAKERIVFVEPVFEFGNAAQKLYAILGDQLRTLLPEIEAARLTVVESFPTSILANPLNRTGVVVVDPQRGAG